MPRGVIFTLPLTSPCIVFIDEIVRRVVFAPTPHVITLFDTAEAYYSGPGPIRLNDPYYREFIGNGIPRERIYEIWSNVTTIKRGSVIAPRNTVIQEFGNALEKQCRALSNIVERLRTDFKGQLKANAPKLTLSIPQGSRGVAFDSKLWAWWEELQFQTQKLESHQRLTLDAEALEASYEAVRLTNGQPMGVSDEYIFDVLAGSTEAKLDDNEGYLVLGKEGLPGFPLWRAKALIPNTAPPYSPADILENPLWSTLSVKLISFNRGACKAVLKLSHWRETTFAPYLLANSSVDLLNDVFITKGKSSFKWYEIVKEILTAVGNPSIATADINAAKAMGAKATKPGTSSITPLARILWEADAVHAASVITSSQAAAIASYAKAKQDLNDSQTDAVAHCAEKGLTIIWGPPGTGKTKTLAGYIHGLVHNAVQREQPLKLLVSGPTYKAVEEIIGRVVAALDKDKTCPAEIFVGYSSSQTPKSFAVASTHLSVESLHLDDKNPETQVCLASLANSKTVTIIATATMQAYKFAKWGHGSYVAPVFDVVIIDESSQVQVTAAISPIATLKENARLVIAGDHFQMPPIMALEPPKGAEYLVGSIQKYLLKRPFSSQIQPCSLEVNYRSAEDIVAYARSIGYRETLQSSNASTAIHLLAAVPTPASGFPSGMPWSSLWPNILAPENKVLTLLHDDDLSSQSNAFEAKIVAALTWCLRQTVSAELDGRGSGTHAVPSANQFWEQSIGIVTPHRAQRALVIRELKSLFPSDPPDLISSAVDTVEKFQGGERHTIIVTFGVGDADVISGEEAFLMQLERTNVAISRAMAKCLVVMPMTLAGHVPQDKNALETAHAIKDYVEEFCNQELVDHITLGSTSKQAKLRFHK